MSTKVSPRLEDRGPGRETATEAMLPPVVPYLRSLISQADDVPLISDLIAADIGTARCTAAIARAALAWLMDGTEDEIRARLAAEIEFNDRFTAWWFRALPQDIASDAERWQAARRRVSWAELQRRRAA